MYEDRTQNYDQEIHKECLNVIHQFSGSVCNDVLLLRYFSEYFLLVTSYNFMLYFYIYFRYFYKLLFYFVTSYFYQKVQIFCIINNSQVDHQYTVLTDRVAAKSSIFDIFSLLCLSHNT